MIPVLLLLLASSMAPKVSAYASNGSVPCCAWGSGPIKQEDGKRGEAKGDGKALPSLSTLSIPFRPLRPFHLLSDELAISDEQDVLHAAEAALTSIWPDAEVKVVRLSTEATAAQPPLRVRFLDAAPRGRASAKVETRAGDTWTSSGWAYLHVAVYDTALVLTRDVDRGTDLADAIQRQRVEVTSTPDPPLSPDLSLEGWSAARSLRAGTVLTARLADAPSAVENRAPLRVRYTRGGLSVTLSCESRERGAIGDTIRAACSDPRATYHVRLTAPGEGIWTRTL